MRLNRFGAATTCVRNRIMCVSGGITKDNLIDEEDEIALYQQSRTLQGGSDPCSWVQLHQKYDSHLPRMLFAGHSAIGVDNRIVIMGGGAVCFSMGTFWNTGIRTITVLQQQRFLSLDWVQEQRETAATYQYVETLHAETETSLMPAKSNAADKQTDPNSTTNVASRPLISAEEFESIMQTRRPAVFQSQDLGPCVDSWTNEYILEKIGASRPVVVHKAGTDRMDFVAKNFSYETMTFQDFLSGISNSEKLYLRSLSAEKPTEQAASIYVDFPSIAEDFKFPPALDFVRQNMHSCPLRISGPVKMWLHYDVMANVLCQIRGTKKLLLFPPSDVEYLDFAPGASSSSIDCFSDTPPAEMACAHPHEVIMKPGDILFLPPLWLHTAQPVDGTSISVNVFYKDMKAGYAPGKDVYGNRDLQVYENGRTAIQKLAKGMESLPDQMKKFYLLRLAKELMQKAQAVDTQDELEK